MKQLRNRADEDARMIHMSIQMGNDPPISLRRDLEHLMLLVSPIFFQVIIEKNSVIFLLHQKAWIWMVNYSAGSRPLWIVFFFLHKYWHLLWKECTALASNVEASVHSCLVSKYCIVSSGGRVLELLLL